MGKPVVHWKLLSKDPAKVADFYEKVFDWKFSISPKSIIASSKPAARGGINGGIIQPQRPEPWPGNMTFDIDVDDLADYRRRIVAAGSKIIIDEAGCRWHGRVLSLHQSRGAHDGAVETGQELMKQNGEKWSNAGESLLAYSHR